PVSRLRSPNRPGSASSSPDARGSASGATSWASRPRRSSPGAATGHRGGGRICGSSTPRAASGISASAARTSSATRSSPPLRLPPPPAHCHGSPPMRLLHLYWPHLPLRLARARHSDSFPADRPGVPGGQPWTDGTVIDADPAARALGVRLGIPLGSAHRLAPEAAFLDPEPDADAASVEAAFGILAGFSPGLAGVIDHADPAFGLLEIQVDGLERLWGSEPEIVARLAAALASVLPGPPRPGIAGTRFAATVAAGN